MELLRIGTCELCGEQDVELYCVEEYILPEGFEGVACKKCCEYWIDEREIQDNIEFQKEMDRMDW